MIKIHKIFQFDYEEIRDKFRDVNNRIIFIALLFLIVFSVIVLRIFYLQVNRYEYFMRRLKLDTELMSRETFERSTIYDRDGRMLAVSIRKPTIYINPIEIQSMLGPEAKEWFTQILAERTGTSREYIVNAINRNSYFGYISRLIPEDELSYILSVNNLAKEKFPEIKSNIVRYRNEYDRIYPNGDLLRYVLGRTDDFGVGIEGIELVFDNYLRHESQGDRRFRIDGRGNPSRINIASNGHSDQKYDLYLTVSQPIQQRVEEINREIYANHKPLYSIIIVQDVKNGEVLALSVAPSSLQDVLPENRIIANPAISFSYEPGSTFKAVAFSYLLENNMIDINGNNYLFCENGLFSYRKYRFRDVHPYDYLTPREVFIKSSNIGTIKLSMIIPQRDWTDYLKECGFGQKTGISLNAESAGSLINLTLLKDEHSRLLSFIGQGISITPIQLMSFYQAIANDGIVIPPRIVRELRNQHGISIEIDSGEYFSKRLFSENTARILRKLLREAVLEGTGKRAYVENMVVGGKTGTAQIYNPVTKSYSKGRYISSFIGIAPIDNPEIVVMVLVHSPKGQYYGGAVAAPYFSKIADYSVNFIHNFPGIKYIKRFY